MAVDVKEKVVETVMLVKGKSIRRVRVLLMERFSRLNISMNHCLGELIHFQSKQLFQCHYCLPFY